MDRTIGRWLEVLDGKTKHFLYVSAACTHHRDLITIYGKQDQTKNVIAMLISVR